MLSTELIRYVFPLQLFFKVSFFLLIVECLITSAFLLISNLFISYLLALPQKICVLIGVYQSQCVFFFFFLFLLPHYLGLPQWVSGQESTCQCRRCKFDPWVRKIPQKRKWQPTPIFLPGKSHGQRSLDGHSHGVEKSWTQFSDQNNNHHIIYLSLGS